MPVILVHSPKGGVGSTFIAAQLALQLARRGHEVTAVDLTYQDSLKLHFGLRPSQMLTEVQDRKSDALVVNGVTLVNGYEFSHEPEFEEYVTGDRSAWYVGGKQIRIIDICVLEPGPAALAVLPRIDVSIPTVALPKTMFVLNRLDDRLRLSRHTHNFLRQLFRERLLGTIRRDEAVNEALAMFEPLARFAPTSVAIPDLEALAIAVEGAAGITAASAAAVEAPADAAG
jgi:chromosome partitioning protein